MRDISRTLIAAVACLAIAFVGLNTAYAHEPTNPAEQVTLKPGDVLTILLADSDQAFEVSVRPVTAAASQPVAVRKAAAAVYIDPPGTHRHVLTTGQVIAHEDWNYGDPIAHMGVAGRNWPKYRGPLAPGQAFGQAKTTTVAVSNCPGGVCPLPGSTVVTSSSSSCPNCPQVTTTYQAAAVSGNVTTYVTSQQTTRLFGWFRSWRTARLSARAARWGR